MSYGQADLISVRCSMCHERSALFPDAPHNMPHAGCTKGGWWILDHTTNPRDRVSPSEPVLHSTGVDEGEALGKAKRDPSGVRYDLLLPEFLKIMAKIAHYGAEHYGDGNWKKSRLTGDKGPINHIYKHLQKYQNCEKYDHEEVGEWSHIHLAAIAFNAMMEYYYQSQRME